MHTLPDFAKLVKCAGGIAAIALFPAMLSGQGVVNPGNVFSSPETGTVFRPVFDPSGAPLVGSNYLAQIVYGSSAETLTNLLGAPMPFRNVSPSHARAGAWTPGEDNPRTLQGFREGDRVLMQVYVWDSFYFSGVEQVRPILDQGSFAWGCTPAQLAGRSGIYAYQVGNSGNPSAHGMVGFQSFQASHVVRFYPPYAVDIAQGGRWLGSLLSNENARSVSINPLAYSESRSTESFTGNEPVGSVIESVSIGSPFDLTRVTSSNPFASTTLISGSMTEFQLATDQGFAESDLLSISGTATNAVINIKQAVLGRIELVLRHPQNSPPAGVGCIIPKKFVIDLRPSGNANGLAISADFSKLRLRLDSGRGHRLLRSGDLATWETLDTYQVGFPVCQSFDPGGSCWVHADGDEIRRSADFEMPLQNWLPSAGGRTVFFRLESQ